MPARHVVSVIPPPPRKIKSHKTAIYSTVISRNSDDDLKILKISVYRIAGAQAAVISRFGDRI